MNSGQPASGPGGNAGLTFNMNFGGGAPAPTAVGFGPTANAPGPAPSFLFGSTAANTPAPPTTTAPAPAGTGATGGLSFGGVPFGSPAASSTTAAPPTGNVAAAANTATAPAPGHGFTDAAAPLFGTGSNTLAATTTTAGNAAAPSATTAFGGAPLSSAPGPAAAGLNFGNTPATSATTAAAGFGTLTATTHSATPTGLKVAEFSARFPNEQMWSNLSPLLERVAVSTEDGRVAGLELIECLRCDNNNNNASSTGSGQSPPIGRHLIDLKPLEYAAPDMNLRNQLQCQLKVVLPGDVEAALTPEMLREVFELADDLHISENDALVLYAEASNDATREMLQEKIDESIVDQALSPEQGTSGAVFLGTNVAKAARELYFFERRRLLRTIMILLQARIEAIQQQQRWWKLVLEATDSLLQNDLIKRLIALTRDWSKLVTRIEQELLRKEAAEMASHSLLPPSHSHNHKPSFDQVHLQFGLAERQTAAECLFYIAYHTQCLPTEVADIIDLVKDLSNGVEGDDGLTVLNPFHNVPSPYEAVPLGDAAWVTYNNFTMPPLKEKNPLEWEKDLVKKIWKNSKPQLLQCVSTLTMTVISSLDAKQILVDRDSHEPNNFGVGNMLLPPNGLSTDALKPIHERLIPAACGSWKQRHVWGLFPAAYALLLRSVPAILSSPRPGSHSLSASVDVRSNFGALLGAPTELKSLSFARLCLIPAFQKPSRIPATKCDTSEFLLSVLSEFVAQFMEILSATGDLPSSRAKWLSEQKEYLELQRQQQESQRQFQAWSGTTGGDDEPVPTHPNLLKRPDCLDDLIALAVAVCSLGPDYALPFWKNGEYSEDGKAPVPMLFRSCALEQLEAELEGDESLLSPYLAFLSALARADNAELHVNGATAVFRLLSDNTAGGNNSTSSMRMTWRQIFELLRWYARELSSQSYGTASASSATGGVGASGASTTSYYYSSSSNSSNSIQQATANTVTEAKELGETNNFYLQSLLFLVSNVAKNSPSSRLDLLSIKLPIAGADSTSQIGYDVVLNVMFTLATAHLPPEVRGAAFTTIASLLDTESCTNDDATKIREMAATAWSLVDTCQILPIYLLDQYPQASDGTVRVAPGLRFPPSSTSLAGNGAKDSPFPADPAYAILYEMEHVESRMGYYPSTEGFLELLASLFASGGCPSDLGASFRPRTGCSPYIEYVIHYVLPRATGSFDNTPKLPFRTLFDQCRLISRCLQVVQNCLVRYSFKISSSPHAATVPDIFSARNALKLKDLAQRVVATDNNSMGVTAVLNRHTLDFRNASVGSVLAVATDASPVGGTQTVAHTQHQRGTSSSLPASKSPGFTILADLLSSTDGDLYKALSLVLSENHVDSIYGAEASKLAYAYALFIETPPNLTSARAGAKDRKHSSTRATLLKKLQPRAECMSWEDAVYWREQAIILSLNIFCAAAVREEAFYEAIASVNTTLNIVPVLRFEKRNPYASRLKALEVHPSRLPELLMHSAVSQKTLASTVDFIGYTASSDVHDIAIASGALSLVYFLHQSLPRSTATHLICGGNDGNARDFALAVARRVAASSPRCNQSVPDFQLVELIMEWILSDLRKHENLGPTQSLSEVLMGLPSGNSNGLWRPGKIKSFRSPKDCFDVILDLLKDINFIMGSSTAVFASNCFEILVRLCDLKVDFRKAMYSSERLRYSYFWRSQLALFFSNGSRGSVLESICAENMPESKQGHGHVLHALSWLLKGLAGELILLKGFHGDGTLVGFLPPQLRQCEELLSRLFGSPDLLRNVVTHLPLERSPLLEASPLPSRDVMRAAICKLPGSAEIVDGYFVIDESILASKLPGNDECMKWARNWNSFVLFDCASAHLSAAIRIIVGASLVCCGDCFASTNPRGGLGILATKPSSGLRIDSLISLLCTILTRLAQQDASAAVTSGTAARNLCWAALLVSEHLVTGTIGSADLRTVRDLLAQAVCSLGQNIGGAEAVRFHECVAVLSSALVLVMDVIPGVEAIDIDHAVFLEAALILARISTFSADGMSASPSAAATVARACLSNLIEYFGHDVDPNIQEESLVYGVLTHVNPQAQFKNVNSFLQLVVSLDLGIATLLQKICQVPFGANILLDHGLVEALLRAADAYTHEEQLLTSGSQGLQVEFPRFVKGHLDLLSYLMASEHLTQEHHRALPQHFIQIVTKYEAVIKRLFGDFPSNPSGLKTFVGCIAQATLLADGDSLFSQGQRASTLQSLSGRGVSRSLFHGSFVEKNIISVSLHIAENLLPSHLLVPLPYALREKEAPNKSGVVTVSVRQQKSWWHGFTFDSTPKFDFFATLDGTSNGAFKDWTEDMFRHAILGAELLNSGLVLVRGNPQVSAGMKVLLRGLCSTAHVAKVLESAQEMDEFMDTDGESVLPLDERRGIMSFLGEKIGRNAEILLLLLLTRSVQPENLTAHEQTPEFTRLIADALDHTLIETRGIGCLSRKDFGKRLARELRLTSMQ